MTPVATLERIDIPSKYFMLRVSRAAWTDLAINTRSARFDPAIGANHPLISKFFADCSDAATLDDGEPLRQVEHPKVFRIRADDPRGAFRGAVWFDKQSGVLWLLRAVAISDFHGDEDKAYRHFGRLEEQHLLFPSDTETIEARQDHLLASILEALREAAADALEQPETWVPAVIVTPGGERIPAGRIYMQVDDVVTRFFLVLSVDRRRAEMLPPMWRAELLTYLFPPDEQHGIPSAAFDVLPAGAELKSRDYPIMFDCITDDLTQWLAPRGASGPLI